MNREEFKKLVESVVVLDGATGTELIKNGMPAGVCPELWVSENPNALHAVQSSYVEAGSQIVYSPTFGGNRVKLANFGLAAHTVDLNEKLARISRQAAPGAYIFGDIAPTGHFVAPSGDMAFDEAVSIYGEQVRGLLAGGVDGFAVETMMDVQEARAAVQAIREACDLPIIVTMTFEEGMRTLTGNDPVSALVALQAMDIDAFGCNCSCGPETMLEIIKVMAPYAKVPLVAKPNAGLPRIVEGRTVFGMGPEEFASHAPKLVEAGVALLGGCCGTTPEHIAAAARFVRSRRSSEWSNAKPGIVVSGPRRSVDLSERFSIIGERINPTGKKALQAELRAGRLDMVWQFAEQQTASGAAVLDVNFGLSGIDEKEMMLSAMGMLASKFDLPLCFDTTNPDVAEAVLREYPGRAMFNSISAEEVRLKTMLPKVAKYGPVLILLPVTDEGVPGTAAERIAVIQRIFDEVVKYGYGKRDVVVDVLAMTVAADGGAANTALAVVDWCVENGFATVCGLSNISHGLPRRDLLNRAFMNCSCSRGLSMAIANPMQNSEIPSKDLEAATAVLLNEPGAMMKFVEAFSGTSMPAASLETASVDERIHLALMRGNSAGIAAIVEEALRAGEAAAHIVDDLLLPGIAEVGERFERKEYFLPQLVASADALKAAMDYLNPMLENRDGNAEKMGKLVIATVKGDIHDIGKNITAMMLRNYGFEVVDLGKDVPAERILEAARAEGAPIVGLSALMTTTMGQMKNVVDLARSRGMDDLTFIVGGAVVDQVFADSIGAFYAADAMATVRIAQNLLKARN